MPGEIHDFFLCFLLSIFSFICMLSKSLFVLLYFFFWSLCCLSFGHCVVCLLVIVLSVFWSLCCLSFGHCVVCLLVIVLSVFWSLCCLSFGHCVVCLLVIVLSVLLILITSLVTSNSSFNWKIRYGIM